MKRTRIDIGRSVRAVWLRVAAVALTIGLTAVTASTPWPVGIAALVSIIGAVAPRSHAAVLGVGALTVAALGSDPALWRTMTAVLGVHIVVVLYALSLRIRVGDRVALAALRPTVRRWLVIQLIAQLLGVVATLFAMDLSEREEPWLATAGAAVAVAGFMVMIVVLFRPPRNPPVPKAGDEVG